MIEHYLDIGAAETARLAESLVAQVRLIGDRARKRLLSDAEKAELMELTGDWESAQIAHLSFIEAENVLLGLRLAGLRR